MVATISLFLVFSAIIANVVQETTGLMCFVCNSLHQPDCDVLKEMKWSDHYKPCSPFQIDDNVTEYRKPLCRKITQKIRTRGNLRLTQRSCGYILHKNIEENICYEVRNEDHEETVCQCFEDGCNSARSISGNLILMFGVIYTSFSLFR